MTDSQANFFHSLGWAVINSLWQIALLWIFYQVAISVLFKKSTPSIKSWGASLLLVAGFAWFIYTFVEAYNSKSFSDGSLSSIFLNVNSNPGLGDWLKQILPLASGLYLSLLIFPILRFARNYRYVQLVSKKGLSKIDVEWRIFVQSITDRMGIKKKVQIWVSEFVSSPVTVGFFKPLILVPIAAINQLSPQQLEAVILHELSHIKRFDYLVNLLINIIHTVLYFNPFIKAFVKIIEREREKSCDEMVLQFQYSSHEYASALFILEKANQINKPLVMAAAGKRKDLLNRIECILGVEKKKTFSLQRIGGLIAGLIIVFLLNAVLIINKQPAGNTFNSIGNVSSAFNFLDGYDEKNFTPVKDNSTLPSINHNIAEAPEPNAGKLSSNLHELLPNTISLVKEASSNYLNSAIRQASSDITEAAPKLKKYQEEQVKAVVDASKKVIENGQWKQVENHLADVFTQNEKEKIKASYQSEINKINWEKWENNLRMAYNKVDWENVNQQLSKAVEQVKMDSLQSVYRHALSQLEKIESTLLENEARGIPDTDISLKLIEKSRKETIRALNEAKSDKAKKIVTL